ncbi:hypothetical protein N7501_003839 [Penicillium viridicatum]|nr:hypothetical protein N7501_003839 [Penicillium viridicatum]
MQVDIDPVLTRPILARGQVRSFFNPNPLRWWTTQAAFYFNIHIILTIWTLSSKLRSSKNIQIDAISALSAGDQRAQPSSRQSVPSRPWEDKASTSRICRKHMG